MIDSIESLLGTKKEIRQTPLLSAVSPGPVAGLKVLAVDEAAGAGLQQRAPEHADVVEAAVGGVRVVAELLGTPELSLLALGHS